MSSFTITTPAASLTLRPAKVLSAKTATGTATYTVTNRTGETRRAGVRIHPAEGTDKQWFSVRGGDERDIGPGATESFSVDLQVPGGSPGHSFVLVVVNLEDPDNDFARSSAVSFDAPSLKTDPPNRLRWWMIAVPVALLVIVVAVILILRGLAKDVTLPNFAGEPLEAVRSESGKLGINLQENPPAQNPPCPAEFYSQTITRQEPESDGTVKVRKSSTVEVGWEWTPKMLDVPAVVGMSFLQAAEKIESSGFKVGATKDVSGDKPAGLYAPAVGSSLPGSGQAKACTPIHLEMVWKEMRILWDHDRYLREYRLRDDLRAVDPGDPH